MSTSIEGIPREPKFPTHNAPRVWFLSCANSPIGISLCRHLLAHGDYVTAGVLPVEFEKHEDRSADFRDFLGEIGTQKDKEPWRARLRVLALDPKVNSQCQSAVADAVQSFGRIDVLFCCHSEVVVGSVEELSQNARTLSLVTGKSICRRLWCGSTSKRHGLLGVSGPV